jgi:hypothetical protein
LKQLITIIIFLFFTSTLLAQKPSTKLLSQSIAAFDKALLNKDSIALKELLDDKISYGHSNGWVQTKSEVIGDLFNGKLTYKTIAPSEATISTEGNTAAARMDVNVEVEMTGKLISLKLRVLQVWLWTNKHWVLFARQSVKL